MATLIRIMRIATLTFALTALVFVLLSLLSGWLPVPDVYAFGIWAPLTIFLACLVTSFWLVVSDHSVASRANLIAVSVLGIGALMFFVSASLFISQGGNEELSGAPNAVIERPSNDSEPPPSPRPRRRPQPQPSGLEPPVPQPTAPQPPVPQPTAPQPPVPQPTAPQPPVPQPPAPQTSTADDSSDTLPNYQWPPETPSWTYTIMRGSDEGSISLYDISDRLYLALRAADYFESSYYRAPGGFVLVTRLEAIDSDGSPLHGGRRFQLPDDDRDFEFAEYIRSLFFAPTGYYRFIAFVVTDRPYVASSDILSEASALARLQAGATALPPNFRDTPFTSNHRIDALIYEFRKTGTDADVETLRPGRVPPKSHLTRSGLYMALQENHL